jgi:hypothetical protein
MRTSTVIASLVLIACLGTTALAERPPERRDKADLVVVGTIKKITSKKSPWGGDGESTSYTAEVTVDKVDRGKGARVGETIKVNWYRVTKSPRKLLPGAYGHSYDIKEKDEATFWLMKGKSDWTIIYNRDGVEKVKK